MLSSFVSLAALLPARPTLRTPCRRRSAAAFMCSADGMACGGGHVVMDYEDFFVDAAPAGEWMLEALRGAVANARVREVHHKLVVLGERGESPPGFTAAVLIDESHVTAHCYSTRGWLALDVFTCGAHDPRALADDIHERVSQYAPRARRVQSRYVPRFLHASPDAADAAAASASPTAVRAPLRSLADNSARLGALRMVGPDSSADGGSSSETVEATDATDAADATAAAADERDPEQRQAQLLAAYRERMEAEGGEVVFRARGDVSTAISDAAALREDVVRGARSGRQNGPPLAAAAAP